MANPTRDTDGRLREGLMAGNEHALAEAYDGHATAVYGLALRITNDHGVAEDIVQDVFLDLWQRPERYDPDAASMRGWLCMIGRRRAIDWLRRQVTRDKYALILAGGPPTVATVEEDVIAATVLKVVRSAVHDLPTPHREAIALAYYYGLTYREVAQRLQIPEGTAKSRLRSGLRRIADRLSAAGFGAQAAGFGTRVETSQLPGG
ncbi:DNA-directed RNA polymerase sigma-70 factor [Virgisporangium aliadipatigenens]|uniref:DNA-directed RNA polymerase sigma-70 factor n=1 Tax=Virgisporangium aliadipatigenens TaxID=741659 RepID=A0A8J3YWS9_9ACTN|nr:sigma-70 family RNA polymerase sigma factor [Virgisporangium aliadipatigenens]GIJ51215.1 DNA-directed RNA polymerase sigma-70 factor [Virgisporangium aliadipatigenens]